MVTTVPVHEQTGGATPRSPLPTPEGVDGIEQEDLPTSGDVVVVGGGVSGLAIAHAIATRDPGRHITVLERRRATWTPHHTWCHWDEGINPVPGAVTATWTRWEIRTDSQVVAASDVDHPYRMVSARDYHAAMRRRLDATGRVDIVMGAAVQDAGATRVRTPRGGLTAATVIDARAASPTAPLSRGRTRLYQRFAGQWIRTSVPVFDPTTVTLMDFTGRGGDDVAFMYVLPVSATEALIESTVLTAHRATFLPFHDDIASYLADRWGLARDQWTIEGHESGCIPMTDEPAAADGPAAVGGAGGLTRPSTGYAYSRVHRHARRVLQHDARLRDVVGEAPAIEREHPCMIPAVTGDLMAGIGDPANELAIAMRDPAEREEGGLAAVTLEQLEDPLDVALDAALEGFPLSALDVRGERGDLEVVLHVDRHRVERRRHRVARRFAHRGSRAAAERPRKRRSTFFSAL